MSESTALFGVRCPSCMDNGGDQSCDNLKVYDDGHGHCFACGFHERSLQHLAERNEAWATRYLPHWYWGKHTADEGDNDMVRGDTGSHLRVEGIQGGSLPKPLAFGRKGNPPSLLEGTCIALDARSISEETCRKWSYQIASANGETVQVANYFDQQGNRIAQKIRTKNKEFIWRGNAKACGLYGKWLWNSGKMIVITEGEMDALSVSQAQGNKWPVVSVRNGAHGAAKDIEKDLEWLEKFETVVLMFDNDTAGREAATNAAPLFSPGKCKIAQLPDGFKDANDLLRAGQATKIIDAIWQAREYRPDGIVQPSDLLEDALKPVEFGFPYPWKRLTELTYGIRPRELIGIGAGTGVGKTDFVQEIVLHLIHECNLAVGLFFLEESPVLSLKKLAGKLAGKRFHIPGGDWTPEELRDAVTELGNNVKFYDHFGVLDWDVIRDKIRYMARSGGIKVFVLDNLTALVAEADDEKKALERTLAEMAGLCQELDITIFYISHLATPEHGAHEEGARVKIRHFKGARAIGFWSHFMIGLERDQQAEDQEERNTTTVRVLKDRYTGNSLGETFKLYYNRDTGRLDEGGHNNTDW